MKSRSLCLRPILVVLCLIGASLLPCGCRALDLEIRLKEINIDPTSVQGVAPLVEAASSRAPGVESVSLLKP